MAEVRIYRPARSAMQAGQRKTRKWRLEFLAGVPQSVEALMGWTASNDTREQVAITFPDRDSAIQFAETHGLQYVLAMPAEPVSGHQSYADNFRPDRRI